jgi:hypothetical protein
VCSIVSTPQMVLTDRLMAGKYPNFVVAVRQIALQEGWKGFYQGWWPALAQKIPSYGLTWMFFEQLKLVFERLFKHKPSSQLNFILGALAAAASVSVMNPLDTIKTRLVMQSMTSPDAYRGIIDCGTRIFQEEGVWTFYRSLPPRLVSVVPMIAIQVSVRSSLNVDY